ncbi:restriction endonuclease [Streptomyces armeniacus]|uniref:restriction endonuclease n=1 Tax=Streptomyces armeniacus TaxID=83291 RepID=UPI0026A32F7D
MVHEGVLLDSQTLRASVAERTEALDKVKALSLLPDGTHVTTRMVANYFEVGLKAIKSLIHDHRAELESNGYRVLTGAELSSFKEPGCLPKHTGRHLAVFTRRTVLNVAMLLRDSVVARHVRRYLLDAEAQQRCPQGVRPVENSVIHNLVEWLDDRLERSVAHQLAQYDARGSRRRSLPPGRLHQRRQHQQQQRPERRSGGPHRGRPHPGRAVQALRSVPQGGER